MSQYEGLRNHLIGRKRSWHATFSEIETVLGFTLPPSARRYPAWWANQKGAGHSQKKAWMDIGWRTRNLSLQQGVVEFVRADEPAETESGHDLSHVRLREIARDYTGIPDDEALSQEAMRALVEREAARRLARMGGTMPDFMAAPRRREENR